MDLPIFHSHRQLLTSTIVDFIGQARPRTSKKRPDIEDLAPAYKKVPFPTQIYIVCKQISETSQNHLDD